MLVRFIPDYMHATGYTAGFSWGQNPEAAP